MGGSNFHLGMSDDNLKFSRTSRLSSS